MPRVMASLGSPRVVASVGIKGGLGKSSLAVSLAAEGVARGLRTLVVDLDTIIRTATRWGSVGAAEGHATPAVIGMTPEMIAAGHLHNVASSYDLIILDTPGHLGAEQKAALMLADVALMPCGASVADAWGLEPTLDLLAVVQQRRPALRGAIVLTRKRENTVLGRTARDELASRGVPILSAEIGYRVAFEEFLGSGKGVAQYAPHDEAARELRALFDELFAVHEEAQGEGRHEKDSESASGTIAAH